MEVTTQLLTTPNQPETLCYHLILPNYHQLHGIESIKVSLREELFQITYLISNIEMFF